MSRPRFYFVEPSKVRTYHITLIDGYLSAIMSSKAITEARDVIVCTCRSLYENLSSFVRRRATWQEIQVIDQDKHTIVRKSLLEFWEILGIMLRMRRDDVMFISCIVPPALILVEYANLILRRKNIFFVIHGEIEAMLDKAALSWRSIGYWALLWQAMRPRKSRINTVVIDDFIKRGLIAAKPQTFREDNVFVAHHPITPFALESEATEVRPIACFIGYRTTSKGFDRFERLAVNHPAIRFVAIGGGAVQDVPSGEKKLIAGSAAFLSAIAESTVALFPYTNAYDCSLSAAVLDALSTGVHVIATPRASFVSLAETFGPDYISVYRTDTELDALLVDTPWLARCKEGQTRRLSSIESSKYGVASVRRDFEVICGLRMGEFRDASALVQNPAAAHIDPLQAQK